MKDIRFNWALPVKYWDKRINNWNWRLPKGGDKMNINLANEIPIKEYESKNAYPWLQMCNNGYRVDKEHGDENCWNGCVFIDLDTKHYYNEVKKFNPEKLEKILYEVLIRDYSNNFFFIQRSFSGTSFHIVFYFNVKKSELNRRKCVNRSKEILESIFVENGIKDIWNYRDKKGKLVTVDKCAVSFYQGMYLTNQKIFFNEKVNGYFLMIDEYEYVEPKILSVNKVEEHVVDFINYSLEQKDIKEVYYEHPERMKIYTGLVACHGTKEATDKAWRENIVPYLKEGNGHDKKFYLDEPNKNHWYERYDTKYVNESWLEKFGYSFKKRFIPKKINLYIPDILIELEEGKRLSDTDIPFKYDKINHLYAGCGVGKTYMSKALGSNVDDIDFLFNGRKRVCFITPLNSISKDSFEDVDGWAIIDSEHKDNDARTTLYGRMNVCTTWESFVLYEMYNVNFDYVILDETHSFYMYDYRVESITQIKRYFQLAKGIRILMTGTPSFETTEFDCYKIEIKRPEVNVRCSVVLYNDSYKGFIMEDIKTWTSDPKHLALIFKDTTNYKIEEDFKMYGLDVDIFNKNYVENNEFVLSNNNVKSQITAFSVYGQAGINLKYSDDVNENKGLITKDVKIRIYILNNTALGIIQYANRLRNKELIDKVIVPYKIDNVSSDIYKVSEVIDLEEAKHKVEVLKSLKKDFDIFNIKTNTFLKLRYGFNIDCVDWNMMLLKDDNYKTYKTIKNVEEYENQLQIIYNRLIAAYFDVNFVELTEDVKFSGDTKMRKNYFAGQMVRFDENMVKESNGKIWLDITPEFERISTGNLKEELVKVLNYMYVDNEFDLDNTVKTFKGYIKNIIKENNTIKKADISRVGLFYELKSKWNTYYNSAFLTLMLNDKWDDIQIASVYMRTIWNDNMFENDWKILVEETYQKLSNIRKVVKDNKSVFVDLENTYPSETIKFENDELMGKIYSYLKDKHTRGTGKGRTKSVKVKGKSFKSVKEAAEYFKVNRKTVRNWLNGS